MEYDVTCTSCGVTAVVDVDDMTDNGSGSYVADSGWSLFFACAGCCDEATYTCPNC